MASFYFHNKLNNEKLAKEHREEPLATFAFEACSSRNKTSTKQIIGWIKIYRINMLWRGGCDTGYGVREEKPDGYMDGIR